MVAINPENLTANTSLREMKRMRKALKKGKQPLMKRMLYIRIKDAQFKHQAKANDLATTNAIKRLQQGIQQ